MGLYDINYPKAEEDLRVVCYDPFETGKVYEGRLEKGDRIFHAKWVKANSTIVDFFDSKQGVSDWLGNFHGDQSLVAERQFFVAHGLVLRVLPLRWNETNKNFEYWSEVIPFIDMRVVAEGLVEIHRANKVVYKGKIRDILDPMLLQPQNIGTAWDAGNNQPKWEYVHTNYSPTSRRDYWPLVPPIPFAGGRIIKLQLKWDPPLALSVGSGLPAAENGLMIEVGLVGLVASVTA